MAKERSKFIQLGVFITVGTLIFISAVYFIGNQSHLFASGYSVSAVFENVKGLQKGNNVRFSGIVVGSVSDLSIYKDSLVKVDMTLVSKIKGVIKTDSKASIGTSGLVGNMIVNISPGSNSAPPAENNSIIGSSSRVSTDEVMSKLGNTSENIALLTVNLLEVIEKINRGQGALGMLIDDEEFSEDLKQTLKNAKNASSELEDMTIELGNTVKGIKDGNGLLPTLLYDSSLTNELSGILTDLDSELIQNTKPIMSELTATSEQLSEASQQLNQFLTDINAGEGVLYTLLQDTAAARNLFETLENLNMSTGKLDENMEAMRQHFLFKKYFKKKEKEDAKKEKANEKKN